MAEGLTLFGVPPENLTAVTGFQLNMVQRPRFTVRLFPPHPDVAGDLRVPAWRRGQRDPLLAGARPEQRAGVGDLPGPLPGQAPEGRALRDADFVRHEAVMSMLQYRHKSRAWLQMVTADKEGNFRAIKDIIAQGIAEGEEGAFDKDADLEALMGRLSQIRDRLATRIAGLPDDATLRAHLEPLNGPALQPSWSSGAWDTGASAARRSRSTGSSKTRNRASRRPPGNRPLPLPREPRSSTLTTNNRA